VLLLLLLHVSGVSIFLFSPWSGQGKGIYIEAAQARRRVTFRRDGVAYDREITTFTEDGRLAQVEYGLEASLRGSTVGAIQVRIPAVGSEKEIDDNGDDDDDGNDNPLPLSSPASSSCIVVCIEHSSFGKMHRIDDHIWMLTAGLSGDARMLANMARRSCQNHRLRYGEAPTVQQAARITADFHHQLTRMGGCRPMGCTAILMGVDNVNGNNAQTQTARLFRTDPGGGFEECRFCAAGKSRDVVSKELMALVGTLDKDENDNDNDDDDDNDSVEKNGSKIRNNGKSNRIARSAVTMARCVLRLLDTNSYSKTGGQPTSETEITTVDVWTIEPREGCRGGMVATCYSDVRKDNVDRILLKQDLI